VALGLLIPVANGLNAAQYITLYAAKWGSGFATNGWNLFVQTAITGTSTLAGEDPTTLAATPTTPEISNLLEFNLTLQSCWSSYGRLPSPPVTVQGYLVKGDSTPPNRMMITSDVTYDQALEFYNYKDIDVVFGSCLVQNGGAAATDCEDQGTGGGEGGADTENLVYTHEKGGVLPICGELTMPTAGAVSGDVDPGSYYIQQQYFEMLKSLWLGSASDPNAEATDADCPATTNFDLAGYSQMEQWGECMTAVYGEDKNAIAPVNPGDPPQTAKLPDTGDVDYLINDPTEGFKMKVKAIIDQGVTDEVSDTRWVQDLSMLGWGGAAIWYNKIAEMNGALITASSNLPTVLHYPKIMEDVRKERLIANADIAGRDAFKPVLSNKNDIQLPADDGPYALKIATVLSESYDLFTDSYIKPTDNIVVDTIRSVFGLNGLYALKDPKNINIHPLAQLVGVGKSLVDSAIRGLAVGAGASVGGGIAYSAGLNALGAAATMVASMITSICMISLGIGFILYYVVPFLPFIYFFFAVGTWVKGIFEAMVGVPLWALAHIRIDGEGLPGSAAAGGYFMILEIFLRPIMIVFGLLASIIIFSAQVRVLNDIWSLVTSNLTGFDVTDAAAIPTAGATGALTEMRDIIDQFCFTIIYAIIVYMLGMASFKLINQIPSNIMRWMGATVQAFNDGSSDPAQGLICNISGGELVLASSMQTVQGQLGKVGQLIGKHAGAKGG
jgi:conjugal transfer/type IV secretion protein DotA/TraY